MPKKSPSPKKQSASRTRTRTAPLAIPPLATAIAKLMDGQATGMPDDFLRAYARMPDFVAKVQAGHDDEKWAVIGDVCGLYAAQRKAEQQPRFQTTPTSWGTEEGADDAMVVAVSVLNEKDVDLVAGLTTPIMDGAFFVGVAYACYMLAIGAAR